MFKKYLFLTLVTLAVFVPTAINLYPMVKEEIHLRQKPVFRLPVSGFDPRDITRGRYATLQIDWKVDRAQLGCELPLDNKDYTDEAFECGLCMTKISAEKTLIQLLPSAAISPDLCEFSFRTVYLTRHSGKLSYRPIMPPGNLRVYLDERYADKVDKALQGGAHDFSADIVFKDDRTPVLRRFYIDNRPYEAFAQEP